MPRIMRPPARKTGSWIDREARARRYVWLSPALLRWLRLGRGSEGGARSRRIRRQAGDLGGGRRLGGDPAYRRLLRRLRPGEAGQGWRQDQSEGGGGDS